MRIAVTGVRTVFPRISGLLVAVALSLLVPGSASALPPVNIDFAPTRSGEAICDQLTTVTVTHPRSVRPAKVGSSYGWRVGASATDRGIPVAVIAATEPVRDAKGDLGIQWTLQGAYAACDEPERPHFFDHSFGIRVKAKPRPPRVECWDSYGGEYTFRERVKPRLCMFNGDEAHARQVPLWKMRWRSWGGRTACGRGEFFYNMGYRAPARFCLYRPVANYGGVYVYTRIRGVVGRGCAPDYGCGLGKRTRFDTQTG